MGVSAKEVSWELKKKKKEYEERGSWWSIPRMKAKLKHYVEIIPLIKEKTSTEM